MDSQDQNHGGTSRIVSILRKATRVVQLVPFFYLVAFLLYLVSDFVFGESIVGFLDMIMATSPSVIVFFLVLSGLFRLCVFHKIACLLPGVSQLESFIDTYFITFTQTELHIIHIVLCLIVLLYLKDTYTHFFYGGEKVHR